MHNCFPFTLSIKKFHTKTPYESRMCTVDWCYDRWTEYDETWQNLMPSAKYLWRSDSMSWHLIGWDILVHLTDGSSALLWVCVVRISPYVRFTFLTSPKRWTEYEETRRVKLLKFKRGRSSSLHLAKEGDFTWSHSRILISSYNIQIPAEILKIMRYFFLI